MADDRNKLEGQREAVEDHIEKYKMYDSEEDKEFALKTIRNAQTRIRDILQDHPHWEGSWQDEWDPN